MGSSSLAVVVPGLQQVGPSPRLSALFLKLPQSAGDTSLHGGPDTPEGLVDTVEVEMEEVQGYATGVVLELCGETIEQATVETHGHAQDQMPDFSTGRADVARMGIALHDAAGLRTAPRNSRARRTESWT